MSQTAGMHRLEEKMVHSNYPLLPTWVIDCTNLHANGHVYYTGGIAKHKMLLINEWLCFCYKNEIQTLQSPSFAVINTHPANATYRYTVIHTSLKDFFVSFILWLKCWKQLLHHDHAFVIITYLITQKNQKSHKCQVCK